MMSTVGKKLDETLTRYGTCNDVNSGKKLDETLTRYGTCNDVNSRQETRRDTDQVWYLQ